MGVVKPVSRVVAGGRNIGEVPKVPEVPKDAKETEEAESKKPPEGGVFGG